MGAIFSLLSGAFSVISTLLGMKRDNALKNEGRQEQATADQQASVTEAESGQKIDAAVSTASREQLIDSLVQQPRAPGNG